MNYLEAIKYIEDLGRFGWKLSLERIEYLVKCFANPQERFKAIHIGGTKGKGSTVAMVASILGVEGFKVGTFTSPHLYHFRERITVNNEQIAKIELARLVTKCKSFIDTCARDPNLGQPTQFEVATLLAFLYFAEKGVDFGVIEVGLGGTYDATNVINPLVSVITNVSIDHTDRLGDTKVKIAKEKAGIIKPQGIVITAAQDESVFGILARECKLKGARLFRVGEDITYEKQAFGLKGQTFSVNGLFGKYSDLHISLLGDFQLANAACAIGAVEVLRFYGVDVSDAVIAEGLRQVKVPGRVQIMRYNPTVIIDGAHNPDSASNLRKTIKDYFKFDRFILVIGMLADKPIAETIEEIVPMADLVVITKPNSERAAGVEILVQEVKKYTSKVKAIDDVGEAVNYALRIAQPGDLVCITGSFYTIGEVKPFSLGIHE